MATRQFITTFARQRVSQQLLNTCRRNIHTSFVRFNVEKNTHTAEALTNKFVGQVQRQNKPFRGEPTRLVQIDALPNTATKEDVLKLAREAFPEGDKSVVETVFCRNLEFNFRGRCVVLMSDTETAKKLYEYGNRRSVGGNIIRMSFTGNNNADPSSVLNGLRSPELGSFTDSTSFSGCAVIFSGLPKGTSTTQLMGHLRSKNFFPIEGVSDNVVPLQTKEQSTVSKFLVKFDSESEAWRCVRSFHNSDFLLNAWNRKFKLIVSVAY